VGQKVNPIAFRIGVGKEWQARWFGGHGKYAKNLLEDIKIRRFLEERLKMAGVVAVEIERLFPKVKIIIHVARPGIVIGRGGTGLEELKKLLISQISTPEPEKNVQIEVVEVKNPEISAPLVAARIAGELERRLPHRRTVERNMERVMSAGAKGIKVVLGGRINGAEISRRERFVQGKVPLATIRADIDFTSYPALTKLGYIGVKVWIYKE